MPLSRPFTVFGFGELAQLARLHRDRHLELKTSEGLDGTIHVNGSPNLVVSELLQMATFAAILLEEADRNPQAQARWVVDRAELRMRRDH